MIYYVISDDYHAAKKAVYKFDLSHGDVKFVSHPHVLKGAEAGKCKVLFVAPFDNTPEAIIASVADKGIEPEIIEL